MTSFRRLTALKAITLSAALSMTAGLALAADNNVSTDQILSALQPKPLTRGLSAGPQIDPAAKAKEIGFVQALRNRKTRSLSMGEREEIAEIASSKPKIDLDIQFDYNSAEISANSLPAVQSSARRWTPIWKGPDLRRRRPHRCPRRRRIQSAPVGAPRLDSIKKYLVDKFGIAGSDLVAVGYGKDKPKDPSAPMDPTNRRVQVVNMDTKTASR